MLCLNLFTYLKSSSADLAIAFNVSHYQGGNNISCYGATDGMVEAVIVGGTAPYTYSWNTGSYNRVLTGIGSGVYTFTVTDATSQTISASINLIAPKPLILKLLPVERGGYNISEQGGKDGKIFTEVKGGSLPYSYVWSTGSSDEGLADLRAGTYSLTITDANGCTLSDSKTLTEPTPLHVVSITSPLHHGYNVSCYRGSDGQIDLTVTGGVPPYKYGWNTGSFEEDISGLQAGEYMVKITDSNEAEILATITLTQPTNSLKLTLTPQVYANSFNLSCHDCANGSLTAIGIGGVSPYTYLWPNGQTTSTISGLQAIEYRCFVTDANGCTNSDALTLRAPDRDDWSMNGNANIDPATQFMGTTDNKDFVIKTNNSERIRVASSGTITLKGTIKADGLAGVGYKPVFLDASGNLLRGPIVLPGAAPCTIPLNPWMNTSTPNDITNCSGKVGINYNEPVDYLHVSGAGRFADLALATNYIRLGHDGSNSFINKFGSGDLRLNSTIYIKDNGRIGIGTANPEQPFEISHNDGATIAAGIGLRNTSGTNLNSEIKFYGPPSATTSDELWSIGCDIRHIGEHNFFIYDNAATNINPTRFYIDADGRIGIGVIPPTSWDVGGAEYRLYVKGGIKTQDVKVTTLNFPDYVFDESYKLMTIDELNKFIKLNRHLPGIPSAKTIAEEDGFQVGEMQTRLIEKVEEQALYIINLQQQIDELKSAISDFVKK